jgi:cytochrome c peroxidase
MAQNGDSNASPQRQLLSRFLKRIQIIVIWAKGTLGKATHLAARLSKSMKKSAAVAAIVTGAILAGHTVSAQVASPNPLNKVPVPKPANLGEFVSNETAAIALGKSLFWDMQLGVDGIQSCASCHFHAGADNRSKNQINPGQGNVFEVGGRPNYQLTAADFPFHKLADPNDRSSNVVSDSNDIAGSQGVFRSEFVEVATGGSDKDTVTPLKDEVFNVQGTNVRQVTARHTPTVINAVFNFRNFWDGRAQDVFNGANGLGLRDPKAFIFKASNPRQLEEVKVKIENSSLASQAVGPPLSALETFAENPPIGPFLVQASQTNDTIRVSDANTGKEVAVLNAEGQTISGSADLSTSGAADANNQNSSNSSIGFGRQPPDESSPGVPFRRVGRKLGKKLLGLRPLNKQLVARDDSVLGIYSRGSQPGLGLSYERLIQIAFKPEWWNSNLIIQIDPEKQQRRFIRRPRNRPLTTNEYTLAEYNFSLFFGLAVQAYESTLVSDQTPFDQFLANDTKALTEQQRRGWEIFRNPTINAGVAQKGAGLCINCHIGSELTSASVSTVATGRIRRFAGRVQDTGFFNIGVRPSAEDVGVGGNDNAGELEKTPNPANNNPLSEARLALQGRFKQIFGVEPPLIPSSEQDLVADGAFKTPGLRNVELTAPYFHNGGQLTLRQVVDFYARGGDFENRLLKLDLTEEDKQALVAFLQSLTDERVRFQRAPFDHPQLFVPNGHPGDQTAVAVDNKVQTGNDFKQAQDALLEIPAVGRNGGNPTPNFLGANSTTGGTLVR